MRNQFFLFSIITLLLEIPLLFFFPQLQWNLIIVLPIIILGVYDSFQFKRTIMRNYPIFGRLRYIMEDLRPKIYQYFVESDTDGTPINRILRSVVYQRAKKQLSTAPFGTQLDYYSPGHEWINHTISPLNHHEIDLCDLRVSVGGKQCKQPYNLSLLNISAMSFGALSKNAVLAFNKGAKMGNFAHNTGEGGISAHHLKFGGDLIWQIGTGLFGCRDKNGNFEEKSFIKNSRIANVKMIEVKISQGAKPGHGGILPAEKNTKEIAAIRGVEPFTQVVSPSRHEGFNGPEELLHFIQKLRNLSEGKPVGFKICFGHTQEFEDICKAIIKTKIVPDFITIDGGEGGTGAAPLEFTNSIGMGLIDGVTKAADLLRAYDLKKDIKIIAAGKLVSGFHMVRILALGADACYSARAMMLAIGCIQSLLCNSNHCPTGVATQNKMLMKGIHIDSKAQRVKNFHDETLISVSEILAASGIKKADQLQRSDIWRRIDYSTTKSYEELFPSIEEGRAIQKMKIV